MTRGRTSFEEQKAKLLDPMTSEDEAIGAIHNLLRLWKKPPEDTTKVRMRLAVDTLDKLLMEVVANHDEMSSVRREALVVFAQLFVLGAGYENMPYIEFLIKHWSFLDIEGRANLSVANYADRCWQHAFFDVAGDSRAEFLVQVADLLAVAGEWKTLLCRGVFCAIPTMHRLIIQNSGLQHQSRKKQGLEWPHWHKVGDVYVPMGEWLSRDLIFTDKDLLQSDMKECADISLRFTQVGRPDREKDRAYVALMEFSAFVSMFRTLCEEAISRKF